MSANMVAVLYLVSALLFIFALRGLSHPESSRLGNIFGVIGMIIAFQEMAKQTKVLPSDLAGGIYTAMITTAAGLIVGIIAYIAYNYLVSKVDKVIFQLEAKTTEFLDLLHHNE